MAEAVNLQDKIELNLEGGGGGAPRGPVFNYTLYCQHLSKGCMIISSKWFGNIAVFNLNNKCSNYLFYSCDSSGNNEYTYFFVGISRHAIHVHFHGDLFSRL